MRLLFVHRPFIERFERAAFRERLANHARRWGIAWLALVIAAAAFQTNFRFGLNASPSLPNRLFLIHKGELPQRGQYVAFRWPGGGPYPAGVTFVKIVAGMTGDSVTATCPVTSRELSAVPSVVCSHLRTTLAACAIQWHESRMPTRRQRKTVMYNRAANSGDNFGKHSANVVQDKPRRVDSRRTHRERLALPR